MGLWDTYLCISLWPLPHFWSLGKDRRTQASDLVTKYVLRLHESVVFSWVRAQDPFRGFQKKRLSLESPTAWHCSQRQLPVAGDRKGTGVGPAKSHASLLFQGQAHSLGLLARRGDSRWLTPCGAAPMCLSSWGQGNPPAPSRGQLSLPSRPTSYLCFSQCFVVVVKYTCKRRHLNHAHFSMLSTFM